MQTLYKKQWYVGCSALDLRSRNKFCWSPEHYSLFNEPEPTISRCCSSAELRQGEPRLRKVRTIWDIRAPTLLIYVGSGTTTFSRLWTFLQLAHTADYRAPSRSVRVALLFCFTRPLIDSVPLQQHIIPPTPLTDEQVEKVLSDLEHAIRYRLRMDEIIPVEMVSYAVHDGRVFFTAPKLFEASLLLGGSQQDDGWFFVNVRFLFTIGGDLTGIQGRHQSLLVPFRM